MLTYSSLIFDPFNLPEVKDFSNLKPCDILNSGRLNEPEISDSVYELTMNYRYLPYSSGFRS